MKMPSTRSKSAARDQVLCRAEAREKSDGAIIFVTAMTLAVLSSLGLYALAATRTEVRSSGYTTRSVMSEGVQEWALNVAMNHLIAASDNDVKKSTAASSYNASANTLHGCVALANVPTTASTTSRGCLRLGMNSYVGGSATGSPQVPPILWSESGTHAYQATPDFFTEMTNADQPLQPVAGNDLAGSSKYVLVTLTAYGILRMNTTSALNTSLEVVKQGRAHLVVGPVQM